MVRKSGVGVVTEQEEKESGGGGNLFRGACRGRVLAVLRAAAASGCNRPDNCLIFPTATGYDC